MKPRIHCVSPLPSAQTDIAHYTRRILPELAAATDLVLWTDATEWDRELYKFCPIRRLDPDRVMPRDFARAGRRDGMMGRGPETVFVNIGNAWPFHAGFLRMIQRIPSVVILHDMAIQELCIDAIRNKLLPHEVYNASMAHWHGQGGLQKAQDVLAGRSKAGDLAQEIPGFEITLPCAVSAVTHTSIARDAVNATGTVPTYLLDLPFHPSTQKPQVTPSGIGPLRFVQFGYTGPNRRLQQVLEALAPLKGEVDFRLDIMGSVWDPPYIQRCIDELGLSQNVKLHGFVQESVLDQKLREAHLVFNLRYPTMGEASGSQLRIWNAAAPSVVTNLGWYAALPSNTVFRIEQDEEIPALQALVRKIHADPSIGRVVGAAGRARLEERHTPSHYVKAVMDVAAQFSADAATATRTRRLQAIIPDEGNAAEIYQATLKKFA